MELYVMFDIRDGGQQGSVWRETWRRPQTSHNVAKQLMIAAIDLWQNSTAFFWCSGSLYNKKMTILEGHLKNWGNLKKDDSKYENDPKKGVWPQK